MDTTPLRMPLCFITALTFASISAVISEAAASYQCREWIDEHQTVHLRAKDERSAFACLGFAHGRDRAWQMDYFKKTAQGHVAEVFGKESIHSDFLMRALNLEKKAGELYKELPQIERENLKAYAEGATAGLKKAVQAGVREFQILQDGPDPWKPEDSIALLLLESFDQTHKNFSHDLEEQKLKEQWGSQAMKGFVEDYLPWDISILKAGEYERKPRSSAYANQESGSSEMDDLGVGSNNWVIVPKRSKSGKAWLANDPHLALNEPPFWYWAHVEGGALNTIGATLPGIPIVVAGANLRAAWGVTNSNLKAMELLYVPKNETRTLPRFRPWIWFKWGFLKLPYFLKTYQRTAEGWITLPLAAPKNKIAFLKWTGLEITAHDIAALFHLDEAQGAGEIDRTLSSAQIPSWNFVFSDSQGHLGYRATGRIPRYESPRGFGISELTLDEAIRWPILPPEAMPHLLDPDRGVIVTANNRHWPPDAVYFGGRAYSPGFRALRIEELLAHTPKHDLKTQQEIQCDVQAVDARFFAPILIDVLKVTDPLERQLKDLIQAWDQQATLECRACVFYRFWMTQFKALTELNEAALYRVLHSSERETFLVQAKQAVKDTIQRFQLTRVSDLPRWGELHRADFHHLSHDPKLNQDHSFSTAGDTFSVNPGPFQLRNNQRLDHHHGASMRMLVEMTSPPKIYAILAGPNRPQSMTKDQIRASYQDWANCQLAPQHFPVDWSQVPSIPLEF